MSDSHNDEQAKQENRPFIRETVINEKPVLSFGRKMLINIALAVVFGVVAAFVFSLVLPRISPPAEESTPSTPFFSFPPEETTPPTAAETVRPTDVSVPEATHTEPDPDELEAMIDRLITARGLDLQNYKQLAMAMNNLSSIAQHSLVTVTAANQIESLFQSGEAVITQSFGVIIAETGSEFLILAPYSSTTPLSEQSSLNVTFFDLSASSATIRAADRVADLMVLSVPIAELSEETYRSVRVMTLGNSNICNTGQLVLAMGAPGGKIRSFNYGILTAVETNVSISDSRIRLLHTNMPAGSNSQGFLINLDGNLIGWLSSDYEDGSCLTAVGISDLRSYIEKLCNGLASGYLGVEGMALTKEESGFLGLEEQGLYILRCDDGSPAQKAGLQRGDILISVAGSPVSTPEGLRNILLGFTAEQTVSVTVLRRGSESWQQLDYNVFIERR